MHLPLSRLDTSKFYFFTYQILFYFVASILIIFSRKLNDLLDALEFNQVVIFVSKVNRAIQLNKILEVRTK